MKDFRQRAFVGLIGLLSAGLISVGCSSSSNNTGTGGSTGTGSGGSHTGGSTGSGGSGTGTGGSGTGTGGAGGGSSANACGPAGTGTTTPPAAMLITDFSNATSGGDAGAGKITFGTTSTVQGGVATFKNPASAAGTVSVTGGALTYMATVSMAGTGEDLYPYSGFVVYINGPACVDASQYTGVSFSIKGDAGTCGLVFSFNDAEHGVMTTDEPRFTGPSGSYPPQKTLTVTSAATTVMVPFNDSTLMNGSPSVATVPVDPKNLTGVQWQFSNTSTSTAPCTGTITVDDIAFYK